MFPGSSCCTWTETNGNIPRQTLNSGHCLPFVPKLPNTSLLTCWTVLESDCLGFLTIFYLNEFWQWKREKFRVSKLYGCMFPGSPCCTQTETNGNAPCSLIILYISVCLFMKKEKKITQVCTRKCKIK